MADKDTKDNKAKGQDEKATAAAATPAPLPTTGLVPVRFLEMYAPYNAGEVAGVDSDLAARLVKMGKASYHGLRHEDGTPAFDGDQPVHLAVAPNHPMRSPSQLAEQQIPNSVTGGAPVAHLTPGLDTSSGRDMRGTSQKPAEVNAAADAKQQSGKK